jgi:hypothetical protein
MNKVLPAITLFASDYYENNMQQINLWLPHNMGYVSDKTVCACLVILAVQHGRGLATKHFK